MWEGCNVMQMTLTPIGVIHSPYKSLSDYPRQASKSGVIAVIEVFEHYAGGLKDSFGLRLNPAGHRAAPQYMICSTGG